MHHTVLRRETIAALLARPDLGPAAKVAWLAIAEAAYPTGLCPMSLTEMVQATALCDKTLRTGLKQLVTANDLLVLRVEGAARFAVSATVYEPPLCTAEDGGRSILPTVDFTDGKQLPIRQQDQALGGNRIPGNGDIPGGVTTAAGAFVPVSHSVQVHAKALEEQPMSELVTAPRVRAGARAVEGGNSDPPPRRKAPQRIPPDWTPSPTALAVLRRTYPGVDLDRVIPEFVAYWTLRGDARASWDLTFKNRLEQLSGRPTVAGAPSGARAPSSSGRPESEGRRALRERAERLIEEEEF